MNINEIKEIIKLVSESKLSTFELENEDFFIKMGKESKNTAVIQTIAAEKVETTKLVETAPIAEVVIEGNRVKAPLVGVFYESSSPDKGPFVKVGDKVSKGDLLCIIEAMKVMNEIVAEEDGVVKEILVKNEDIVEYGQDLFIIA